jgi:hypothetical protein
MQRLLACSSRRTCFDVIDADNFRIDGDRAPNEVDDGVDCDEKPDAYSRAIPSNE